MEAAFFPHPAMSVAFSESIRSDQAAAYVASFFKPGFADIPAFFLEDILRTDGRARSGLATGGYHDQVAVVRDLKAPLAVLHGAEERLVNGAYFATLAMPTLWRGAVQRIAGSGHTPQWEAPQAFDALLAAFVVETA
jgi:pimeloyl-ACP methyl ester carboxylesterase